MITACWLGVLGFVLVGILMTRILLEDHLQHVVKFLLTLEHQV